MPGSVVVVGSVNTDLVVRIRRLPGPGETVIGGTFHRAQGGKGANQAAAAARLGARTWLVGCVGDDAFGREAREDLARAGVDVSHLLIGERPTGVALIMVDDRGENLIAVASGANTQLTPERVVEALGAIAEEEAVVLTNLEVSDEAVAAAAEAAAERGHAFVLNPAPARRLPPELLARCDLLTPNEHEVGDLGFASVDELLSAGARVVVVTRSAEGADLYRPGRPVHHQDAFAVEAVDTTGAGDAFSATVAWALAEGRSLEEAVRLAAAGAALATRALGARASLASRDEIEGMLAGG